MKFVDEYRDADSVARYAQAIRHITTRPWNIMEICGGQTHSVVKHGLDQLLPPEIRLLHGPGCPVCVTSVELIDKAITIASEPEVIFCSFGDMLRVPGSSKDLLTAKAEGGDVRVVYSPRDAVGLAEANPDKQVVFFAIGFETTAPANAVAVAEAVRLGLKNFSVLVAQVLVPPAIEAILSAPECEVNAFLAAGHVCTVMGFHEYERIAAAYRVPIVVTGFEPIDILQGIFMVIQQLESGEVRVENAYSRAVSRLGNEQAQQLMNQVFEPVDRKWRGLGSIALSGLALRDEYSEFDAEKCFGLTDHQVEESTICMSRLILQGRQKPHECPAFGSTCTPEHPLGATMVSSEGPCAAYYRYRKPTTTGSER
jgi:hydrogenase expression/formation protein HypD